MMAEYIEHMKPLIEQIVSDLKIQHEDNIIRAVQNVGINVDRTRLLAALTDARRFYAEGYRDAMNSADVVEVVRCKDCKYGEKDEGENVLSYFCRYDGCDWNYGNHFCSYGERKDADDRP